jgi:UPF0755 protein
VLVKKTPFSAKQLQAVLAHPGQIGLPSYAHGNPEGYLFPATYMIPPNATARSVLTQMVERYKQAAADVDIVAKAQALGYSPHDVMTVASLVQAEARFPKDFAKVARVIYNRLEQQMPLQFDSTARSTRRTAPTSTQACRRRRSPRPGTRPSRRRSTRPPAAGSTSSPPTRTPA